MQTVAAGQRYTITGAPRVIKGKVLIGNGGAEFGVRGYVSAYDAETGKLVWRFYTVPGDPAKGFESSGAGEGRQDLERASGGSSAAAAPSGIRSSTTRSSDLLYIGIGNGSPWNQTLRSPGGGDNLFLSSIVALKPDTGEYVWHYQTTPGETWDYTATQQIILADLKIDGNAAPGADAGAEERLLLRAGSRDGRVDLRAPYATSPGPRGRSETGRPMRPEARYGETRQAVDGDARSGRRAQLAADVVQSAHRARVLPGDRDAGFRYIPEPAQRHPELGWNTGIDFNAASLPEAAAARRIKDSTKGIWRRGIRSRRANCGACSSSSPGLAGCSAPQAISCCRARRRGSSWPTARNGQQAVGGADAGGRARGAHHAMRSTASSSSRSKWAGAAPSGWPRARLARDKHAPVNVPRVLAFKIGGEAKLPELPATLVAKLDSAAGDWQ